MERALESPRQRLVCDDEPNDIRNECAPDCGPAEAEPSLEPPQCVHGGLASVYIGHLHLVAPDDHTWRRMVQHEQTRASRDRDSLAFRTIVVMRVIVVTWVYILPRVVAFVVHFPRFCSAPSRPVT